MSFLMANWQKLLFVNYKVNKELLLPYLPTGLELDDYDNTYYLSFVAMRFDNTRVLGISFPFHKRFEEVNLRFYVKRKLSDGSYKKGVVFISEIVPKRVITMIARMLYNESYQTLAMSHQWLDTKKFQDISYSLHKNNQTHTITVTTDNTNIDIKPQGHQDFIIERYFGYTKNKQDKTIEYEVRHKPWQTQGIINHKIDINFEDVYGEKFSFLNNLKPDSIYFTEGSRTSVENKKILR